MRRIHRLLKNKYKSHAMPSYMVAVVQHLRRNSIAATLRRNDMSKDMAHGNIANLNE